MTTQQESPHVTLYRLAAWLTEGADEHEDGNGAVDLPGRARTAADELRSIAYRAQHDTTTPDLGALGILANSVDRFDLMRAIKRCDELVTEIRQIQMVHSENLCRVANRLAYREEP